MRSKVIQRIMHFLIICVGAGAGAAIAYLCVEVQKLTLAWDMQLWHLITLYVVMCLLGALLGHLAARPVIRWFGEQLGRVERLMDTLSTAQKAAMVVGVIMGFLVAALLSQILHFLGESIFTMSVSAILYVVLGVLGLTIGAHRAEDMASLMAEGRVRKETGATMKLLDTSALTDGRIAAVHRTGVIDGEIATADFILAELQEMTASPDAAKRVRGQRGLDTVKALPNLRIESTDGPAPAETDVALMALAREKHATLLTADSLMHKAARVAGVPTVNLNDLAVALRTVTAAGDVLTVRLSKPGKEPHQGVGYLEDGTMLVVEGGSEHIGGRVEVTVTSVLQTSAGRMAFAKLIEED